MKQSREAILLTDGYKLGHRNQYPKGTEYVYSNWTPRSAHWMNGAEEGAVVFGLQYLIKEYLIRQMNKDFFQRPKDEVVSEFKRRVDTFLGPQNNVGTDHIAALHDLGYLPVRIKSLPEGDVCPIRCPMLTVENTHPDFFWLTNYLETLFSATLWLPCTSATSARLAKKQLMKHATKTGFAREDTGFLCHDFSMRGMAGVEAAILSGMGHMTAFHGSETIPAISALEEYYNADAEKELIAGTVPATEHSVMCAGGKDTELDTYRRLLTEVYPQGFLSIVSDTWDYWHVITSIVPQLKQEIMARDGRLVIRPDSGDPVKIICGWDAKDYDDEMSFQEIHEIPDCEKRGTYELLWEMFGGTVNEAGYKVLDPHVGLIYGDAITLDRQKEIYRRLEAKGFAATNIVLGFGSFTYQYKSRDSLGFAIKATWCQINGEGHDIFKQPKTDSGTKNSLKGLIRVDRDEQGRYHATDGVTREEEQKGCLVTVFEDGRLLKDWTLAEVRENLDKSIENSLKYGWK